MEEFKSLVMLILVSMFIATVSDIILLHGLVK
jgi:hypothetical protein